MLGTRISVLKGLGDILLRHNKASFLRWLSELESIITEKGEPPYGSIDYNPFMPAAVYSAIAKNKEDYEAAIDNYMVRIKELSFKEE